MNPDQDPVQHDFCSSPRDSLTVDFNKPLQNSNGHGGSYLSIPQSEPVPEEDQEDQLGDLVPKRDILPNLQEGASLSRSISRLSRLSGSLNRLSNFRRTPLPWKNFRKKLDAGYGWVVVSAAFLCSFIVDGVANSFGMYLIEFTDLYGEPESVTSWIGSLLVGVYLCMGPVACGLADSYGYRVVIISGSVISAVGFASSFFVHNVYVLFFTFGIVGGIGFGLIYSPSVMCVCSYFKEKSAFAVGIAVCGSSVGGMVFPLIAQIILDKYGWQGSMLLLSGVSLNCMLAGALMKSVKADNEIGGAKSISSVAINVVNRTNSHEKNCRRRIQLPPKLQQALVDMTSLGVYKNPTFLLYSLASFIGSIAFLTPSFFLPDFVIKTGLTAEKEIAATIMTAVNGAGIIGRVFFGWLADRPKLDALAVHNVCIFTAGFTLTMVPLFREFNWLLLDGVLYGLFIAPYISLMSIILTTRLGLDLLPSAFGQTQLLAGIASMIGPPLHGVLKEWFDVSIPFYFAGSAWIFASLVASIIFLLPRPKNSVHSNGKYKPSPPKIVLNGDDPQCDVVERIQLVQPPV